jgi:hypothetical protein
LSTRRGALHGLIAGGVGWIEGQLGEKALARRIAGSDLLKLDEIGAARLGILVNALQMRLIPQPRALEFGRPAGLTRVQQRDSLNEAVPILARAGWSWQIDERADGIGSQADMLQHALR